MLKASYSLITLQVNCCNQSPYEVMADIIHYLDLQPLSYYVVHITPTVTAGLGSQFIVRSDHIPWRLHSRAFHCKHIYSQSTINARVYWLPNWYFCSELWETGKLDQMSTSLPVVELTNWYIMKTMPPSFPPSHKLKNSAKMLWQPMSILTIKESFFWLCMLD